MKKTVSAILCVCMLFGMLGVFQIPAFAAAPTDTGVVFGEGEMYYADDTLSALPHTFEVMFYMPADVNPAVRAGSIISTYTGIDTYYFHFDINTTDGYLYPRFEWKSVYDTSTDSMLRTFNFKNAKIDLGAWNHITVVVDYENAYLHCYKNGEYVQSNAGGIRLGDMDNRAIDYPVVVGNDNRASQEYNFLGKMQSLALYSDIRSSEQIAADYKAINDNDASLLAHWEFRNEDQGKAVSDKSANGIGLTYSKQWLSVSEMETLRAQNNSVTAANAAYSFGVMGDPQNVVEYDVKKGTTYYQQMCKWIADNAKGLKMEYLMTLGDLTDNDTEEEWVIVHNAMTQLNGIVEYSALRGNHDVYNGGTGLDKYFATDSSYMSKYTAQNSGFYKEGSVANVWYTKTVGQTDWMFVHLDFGADDGVVAWANKAIAEHPDHKVIITTHSYLHGDGTTCDDEDTGSTTEDVHNNGHELWAELVSLHKNVVMVLSGHQEFNRVTMTQTKGVNGNTVSQFLIDQQSVDNAFRDEGKPAAIVTMFYFSEDGKTVSIEQYSPVRNEYYHTINQFTFDMTADKNENNGEWNGYAIAPSGSGTENDPYIIENGGNLIWMSKNVKSGSAPSFDGKYFKQVCDIDLNTCAIKPIGNYYESDSSMSAFGGIYDGNGYVIKNGRIAYYSYNHTQNRNYGDGLFGMIYGAEIKNVRLENIEMFANSVTGMIVGRAVAPANNTNPAYNLISGCSVSEDCRIYVNNSNANRKKTPTVYDGNDNDGIVGGICGMAYGTTIEKCVFESDIVLRGFMATADMNNKVVTRCIAGGIAGLVGGSTVVDHCAFTGSITAKEKTPSQPYTIGGIVGLLSGSGAVDVKISNSYTAGELKYTGTSAITNNSYWGGIVGYASVSTKLADTKAYLIENCYNVSERVNVNTSATAFVAGLVGKAETSAVGDVLRINNSASVQGAATGGTGNNEYRADADTTVVASSVSTMTADAVKVHVEAINKVINSDGETDTPEAPDTGDLIITPVIVASVSLMAIVFTLMLCIPKKRRENEI